jgi:hypothetical protein
MPTPQMRDTVLSSLTLLTSVSTLLCCALPALLVAIGAGAVVAGLVTAVPQIVFLSEHKVALFTVAGGLLMGSGVMRYASRNAPCPVDPGGAAACRRLRRFSGSVLYVSIALYGIGFFFAFFAPLFLT